MIEVLGFPIVAFLIAAGAFWIMIRWVQKTLIVKIEQLWSMVVKLIDRVRALDNSVVRLELLMRLMKDLPPDWERMGKLDPEDRRKD